MEKGCNLKKEPVVESSIKLEAGEVPNMLNPLIRILKKNYGNSFIA